MTCSSNSQPLEVYAILLSEKFILPILLLRFISMLQFILLGAMPCTIGVPDLKTGGISLVETRRSGTLLMIVISATYFSTS